MLRKALISCNWRWKNRFSTDQASWSVDIIHCYSASFHASVCPSDWKLWHYLGDAHQYKDCFQCSDRPLFAASIDHSRLLLFQNRVIEILKVRQRILSQDCKMACKHDQLCFPASHSLDPKSASRILWGTKSESTPVSLCSQPANNPNFLHDLVRLRHSNCIQQFFWAFKRVNQVVCSNKWSQIKRRHRSLG